MRYSKKIVVLKEITQGFSVCKKPVSGIVRVEIEDGVANLFLSFVNFRASGRGTYAFFLTDVKKTPFYYELGARPTSFARVMERLPDIEKGFAAGVCFVADDLPTLAAFGRTDECDLTVTDMKSLSAEKCLSLRKQRFKLAETMESAEIATPATAKTATTTTPSAAATGPTTAETPATPATAAKAAKASAKKEKTEVPQEIETEKELLGEPQEFNEIYEDIEETENLEVTAEAEETGEIKDENDADLTESASFAEKPDRDFVYDDEAVATENYYEAEAGENENDGIQFKNELPYFGGKKEEGKESADAYRAQNEEDFGDGEEYSESRPYYLTVKEELNEIFSKFPEETSLKKLFPDSEFSRVNYSADKFYVVGLIKESGEEKYICYGVPGAYSENAPEELAPYCSFIPVSIFDLSGDGYWMMFQSATTGECILLNQNR